MALIKPEKDKKISVDLSGQDGNAFVILGLASDVGKKIGMGQSEINEIKDEMMSGDYENLIVTFDKHFGHVVDLILPKNFKFSDEDDVVSRKMGFKF